MIQNRAVIMPILLILSIQGVIASTLYFSQESDKAIDYLVSKDGQVAGTSTTQIIDLSKEIPMMPDADVVSVDTSIDSASVTLDTSLPEDQVKTYYDDYMLLNNWIAVSDNTYQKDGKELKVEITGNIIKLTLNKQI